MKSQYLWIVLLVILQTASVFCRESSYEISNATENGDGILAGSVRVSSYSSDRDKSWIIAPIVIGSITVVIAVLLIGCICFGCCQRCTKQTRSSGLILSNSGVQMANQVHTAEQADVLHMPPNQPVQQPQYHPPPQFPPHYQPMQQFQPHNHPMQQFSDQKQPMQQFSDQKQPMQQFSQQHSPMKQFSPQNQPMEQFSPQYQPMQQFSPQNQPTQQFSPQYQPVQQFSQQNQPMQDFSPQNQPTQQFSQQHSPMRQSQQSETASPYQFSPESENSSNFSEPPPAYEKVLPEKY